MEILTSPVIGAYGDVWMLQRASLFRREESETAPTVTYRVTETQRLDDHSVEITTHDDTDFHFSLPEFLNSPSAGSHEVQSEVPLPFWHPIFSDFLYSAVALAVGSQHHPDPRRLHLFVEVKVFYGEEEDMDDLLVFDPMLGDIHGDQPPSPEGFGSLPPPPPTRSNSAASLGNLERVKYQGPSVHQFGQEECPICFEEFQTQGAELARMPCSHLFHCHCIAKWLEHSRLCPLCRLQVPE